MGDPTKLVDSLTLLHLLLAFCNQYTSMTGIVLELECRNFSDISEEGMDLVNKSLSHTPVTVDKVTAATSPSDNEEDIGKWAIYLDSTTRTRIEQSSNDALKQIIQSFY